MKREAGMFWGQFIAGAAACKDEEDDRRRHPLVARAARLCAQDYYKNQQGYTGQQYPPGKLLSPRQTADGLMLGARWAEIAAIHLAYISACRVSTFTLFSHSSEFPGPTP